MTKRQHRSAAEAILGRGGGNATASGVDFQAKLGACFATHMLTERPLDAQLTGSQVQSLRYETEAPIDDILIETEKGWIFVQAKASLAFSTGPESEFVKTAEQFVRQWLACSAGNGDRKWDRPLQPYRDRLLLAVGPGTSQTISRDLAQGLVALQAPSSAPLAKSKADAVKKFEELLKGAWQAVTGRSAAFEEIRAISNFVTIRTVDLDGPDRQAAAEMLRQAIDDPSQAGAAFAAITQHCQELMRQRTGCDMASLRHALTAMGVLLKAPPSYRADVESLRRFSGQVQKQLSDYETTKVGQVKIVVKRECTNAVVDAAHTGSLLLVGEPGAGKSAVINASAAKLREKGYDVIELAVDRLPVNSLSELAQEIGLTHSVSDVLLNWPGNQPAFLFIDALDATRGGVNEAVFRTLIADVLSFEARQWHVIASIRTFDLRLGEQFRRLFNGFPPNATFADPAFPSVIHVQVPPWTDAELGELLKAAPTLATAIDAGGERLRELALVPFNTRLLADLISSGLAASAFGEVQSQVQLLALYWNKRVEKHGTGAELCLHAAVAQMVETRSLRARKLDAARPDSHVFDALLHENVIVPLKNEQFVAFRHHILFDYAASRVYLNADDVAKTADLLKEGNGLGFMLAPALAFALQQLWNDDDAARGRFWDAVVRFSGDPDCDPVVRSVAARTASELPRVSDDAVGLLRRLSAQGTQKAYATAALGHVVGALAVRFDDKQPIFLDPWCELAKRASEHFPDTVWQLRALLYVLYKQIGTATHRAQLGHAARNLLAYSLDPSNAAAHLSSAAIDFVTATYASDIDASRQLLKRLFEPGHFQEHADQEIPWLVRGLKPISEVDPEFVIDIYGNVFGGAISDASSTSMGQSQILPLFSNRRQDYEHAWWELSEFFPRFLKDHPAYAVRALIRALRGYIDRAHPIGNDLRARDIQTVDGHVRLQEDNSHIWAWDVDESDHDNAQRLIRSFVREIEIAVPEQARAMVGEIIARNEIAVLWSRTFLAASKRAEDLGSMLWPIATQEPFLASDDTRKDTIDFIAARYPFEDAASREAFERRALGFNFDQRGQAEKLRLRILSTLFSSIAEQNLATAEAREILAGVMAAEGAIEPNMRPFLITSSSGSPEKWWWLSRAGIDLAASDVARVLAETEVVEKNLGLENRDDEIADISFAIACVKALIELTEAVPANFPQQVAEHAFAIAAKGTAKLSRLPVKRLRELDDTIPSLVTLVKRLAQIPTEPSGPEEEARFESSASWSSPDARVETAQAVAHLCQIESNIVEQLRTTIEMLLDCDNPPVRMQIAERLTALWNTSRPFMWELADRIARNESNRGVLRFFTNYFLGRIIHADPQRTEELVSVLRARDFDRSEEPTKLLFEEIGSLIGLLWISHGREGSRNLLQVWIDDPHTFEVELSHAITVSRGALVLKYHSADGKDIEVTRRAQEFCGWAVAAMADGLEAYLDQVQDHFPTDAEKDRGTVYARLLDLLCDQIYFASGAFRSGDKGDAVLTTIESKQNFLSDLRPVLARIADAGTPHTIHHLIDLLDFLVPADPAGVFDLVAHALLGAGCRHRYQFESLGAARFVEIVGHYIADHRELFTDEQRRQQMVNCLNIFMEAGWPAARRLLYRLPELLQ